MIVFFPFISLVYLSYLLLISMNFNVETMVIRNPKTPPRDALQSGKINASDVDYEVYAYYLPFLKEQNVTNEKTDYSYYENDDMSYYSYDKSADIENNRSLRSKNDVVLRRVKDGTRRDLRRDDTESGSIAETVLGSLTASKDITKNGLLKLAEHKNRGNQLEDEALSLETPTPTTIQDVTEPSSQEKKNVALQSEGTTITHNGLSISPANHDTSLMSADSLRQEVTEPGILAKIVDGTRTNNSQVASNASEDSGGEKLVEDICWRLSDSEVDTAVIKLFACPSSEFQFACVGLDRQIGDCSEMSDVYAAPRKICVENEGKPFVVACNDSSSFCFESSIKERIAPCNDDDMRRVCLHGKGIIEFCSAV